SPPMLVEGAIVWSPAASASGTLIQRRRWEGGFLATMLKTAPTALVRSLRRADIRGFSAALDLAIPPLALLAMLNIVALAIALLAALASAESWPIAAQSVVCILAAF